MSRKTLSFIALAITMLYGVGFAAFDGRPQWYAPLGGVLVALSWIAVGTLGKPDPEPPAPPTTAGATPTLPTTDPTLTQSTPWGTSPTTEDAPPSEGRS